MKRNIKFAVNDIQKIHLEDYAEDEFSIARMGFLSTRPNSHELNISEDVLRQSAPSVLGKWVVADMTAIIDAGTHTDNQTIVGRVPENQTVEFVKDDDGYLRAYVDTIISKVYARDYCAMFEGDNDRAVSVEMTVETSEEDENEVLSFRIVGVTTLGHAIRPSCPQSNITFTRFSEEDANVFFNKVHKNSLTALEQFAESRKKLMAEAKTYKIDKSKEAMSTADWSNVDKTALRNKIIEAKNASALVKSAYLKIDTDWSEAPSERLHYPVMQFDGDTLVYNRNALSNALARAVQNDETTVVNKINKIYKNLGLDQDGKEEGTKMAEVNFEIEGRKAWAKVIKKVQDHEGNGAYVDSIEDNHIIYTKNNVRYRVEADIKVDKDDKSVDANIKWDTVKKDADQKMSEDEAKTKEKKMSDDCDNDHDDDNDVEMSADEMKAEMAKMKSEIEDRDNIIMEKDKKMEEMEKELAELREYKNDCMEKERACSVESVMSEVKDFVDEAQFNSLRDEGMACDFAQIDAWSNKVKAIGFEAGKRSIKTKSNILSFAAPIDNKNKQSGSVWVRL